jgi:hypothetical protein
MGPPFNSYFQRARALQQLAHMVPGPVAHRTGLVPPNVDQFLLLFFNDYGNLGAI